MPEHVIVFIVLAAAMALFVFERWRYDVVALLALLTLALLGIVSADEAFAGFGHPAVITVAAVLILSRGLADSGVVDYFSQLLRRVGPNPVLQVAALAGAVAFCSAFMNNVGALALLMPVTVRLAQENRVSPSILLMPLASASLLGGMITLIGTPPNIIIASFRSQSGAAPFRLFDFAPVGAVVAVAGIVYLALLGWRLIPSRKSGDSLAEIFRIGDYTTEVRVPAGSPLVGKQLQEVKVEGAGDFVVVAILRGEHRLLAPVASEILSAGDRLIVEIDPEKLRTWLEATGLELAASQGDEEALLRSEDVSLVEVVVLPRSLLPGQTAEELHLRTRFNVNLLAVAREGERIRHQLKGIRFRPGDVLLLQCPSPDLEKIVSSLGCVLLAERGLQLGARRRALPALAIFGAAVVSLATGWLPAATAFMAAAVAMVLARIVRLRDVYRTVDWSVIVLLAAMIPVGAALEKTGGAALLAEPLLRLGEQVPPALTLAVLLMTTMLLSDVMNNAATAVIMAPVAIGVARGLGASEDPFLMTVAVGASCAFLTPIGHQSNTLVMGPGGYRFGDYWRLGLPLDLLIVALAVPMILWVWPL